MHDYLLKHSPNPSRDRFETMADSTVFEFDASLALSFPLSHPFAPMKFPGTSTSFLFPVSLESSFTIFPPCSCTLLVLRSVARLPLLRFDRRVRHSMISSSRVCSRGNSDGGLGRWIDFSNCILFDVRFEIARNFLQTLLGDYCIARNTSRDVISITFMKSKHEPASQFFQSYHIHI